MKNKSVLLMLLLAAILIASVVINVKQFFKSRADKQRIDLLSKNTGNGYAKIETRYVHDSVEHVVVKEVKVGSDAEKAAAVGAGYLDTVTTALKVAASRIDEVTKVNATLLAENIQLKKSQGSNNVYHYSDKWLRLDYLPDSNRLSMNYDVSLNIAKYWKRKWFLAPKEYYNDIFSDDPRVQINSVKRYTMAEKKQKRFGLGFNFGYSYLPFSNRLEPAFGVGLNYNLVEF